MRKGWTDPVKSFALRNLSAILSLVLLLGLSATAFDVSAQSTAVTTQSLSKKSVSTTVTMWSRALGRETTYTVIMPAERQPDTRYPVLYLLHGAYGSYRDWPEKTALLDYAAGRPLLIVCPDGGEFGWYVDSPPNNNYETFLTQELIADVEARFPALPKREARGICGLSMGGHGALSLAAKHPELFCSASAMSGILCLTNHPGKWHLDDRFGPLNEQNDARWRAHSVADLVDRFTTAGIALYFDVGTSDATGAVADNRLVHERLANRGIAHTYAEFEGATRGGIGIGASVLICDSTSTASMNYVLGLPHHLRSAPSSLTICTGIIRSAALHSRPRTPNGVRPARRVGQLYFWAAQALKGSKNVSFFQTT